ncbi:PREDICTED: dolichyl-diphosphooligosaccharide--protein glycosyltransferase subunit 1 [Nicrophorus vespilloides]|uniref:Dolichyl-diphosphooligosaccharide--protein glycosyltransferase subunit 1 n=1 Tax=Nicrophorus vespilloides TaxID=110193 RepID=A0ABM1M5C4_NICVS|nr:PREDICTED: dolichyl-diphosphooligosaccharide--protein glycosyltransferase subunit 1 [Nicrophorus vespilloides]
MPPHSHHKESVGGLGKMVKILLTLLPILTVVSCSPIINPNIVNKHVERIIDLTSQLVKITSTITLENTGKESVNNFHLIFEPGQGGNLSYRILKDTAKDELRVTPVKIENYKDTFNVKLNQPLNSGKTTTITLEYIFTNALVPYPSSITQKERQLVRYFGNVYFYSPYKTVKQSSSIILSSRNIESYTKVKPVSVSDSTINYGPYSEIKPFTTESLVVHYENNSPFLRVTKLDRLIEISHWGNIAVQEDIEILHTGAKLQGPFSRYDYQRDTSSNHHSIKSYKTILPAAAHSIYYRDSNGNISTSQVRARKDWIELELRPRFPLFGGWKSSYTLGYSIPSYQYLYKMPSGSYMLRMRLLDHVFDDMHVDQLETNVVLPLGVTNVQLKFPYSVDRLSDDIAHKYLDSVGRQVIRLKKSNLVEQHIQDLDIVYDWQPFLLFHKPILIAICLYALFLLVIVYVRLDFSIHKPENKKD